MDIVVDGIIFQSQSTGGISRIFHEILPLMCSLDKEVHIDVVTSGKLRQPIPKHARISHIKLLPISSILRPRRFWLRTHEFLRRQLFSRAINADDNSIWLSTYYTMPPLGWTGGTVAFVYDMIHEKYVNLFNKRMDTVFRERKQQVITSADKVICISETTRQDVLSLYHLDIEKVDVAHLAHSPVFRKAEGEVQPLFSRPFILYVGGRSHYKNFHFLLEAYASWAKRDSIHLVVVGNSWTEQEEKLLQQYELTKRVHLFSGITDEQLNIFYNTAKAFVYPSLYEGFGIPLLEAMACGCPLVASDIPSSKEVAADNAYYFDPTSPESLHAALDRATQRNSAPLIVPQSTPRIEQFSWKDTAQTIHEILVNLPK